MNATVIVVHKWAKVDAQEGDMVVDTTNNDANAWTAGINPFLIGPCKLYDGHEAQNMENAWQYAKLYAVHATRNSEPTVAYWQWAMAGWANPKAVRYPMGRGKAPLGSQWQGEMLSYIEARKRIYAPLFAEATQKTAGWKQLQELHRTSKRLFLRDWDGWNMEKHGIRTLTDVLNNPNRKMGHAFVLKMLLDQDEALKQVTLR